MNFGLITVFYYPSYEDVNHYLKIATIFKYASCFLNSDLKEKQKISLNQKRIITFGDGENIGLSKAYNLQFKAMIDKKIDFIFVTDQDSRFKKSTLNQLIKYAENNYNKREKIGIFCLNPVIDNKKVVYENKYNIEQKDFVINSGSLVNKEAWIDVEGYDSNLFIDAIDYDFCKRIKESNWKILKLNNLNFSHSLGNRKNIIWGLFNYSSYNQIRHFNIMQSRLYLYKKYNNNIYSVYKSFKLLILFFKILKHYGIVIFLEPNKIKIIKSLNKLVKKYFFK